MKDLTELDYLVAERVESLGADYLTQDLCFAASTERTRETVHRVAQLLELTEWPFEKVFKATRTFFRETTLGLD